MFRLNEWSHLLALVICIMLLAVIGCQSQPRKTMLERVEAKSGQKLRTTSAELRLKTHHAAQPLSGIIEAHADMILAETVDPAVRKNALLWKINGIPAIQQAAFQPDPFLALLDLWVLSVQMRLFFEEGPGKDALAKWHPLAIKGARQVESLVESMDREISGDGDITAAKEKIEEGSLKHPIESLHFIRPSITLLLAAEIGGQELGTFEIVEAVAVGVADLSQQMSAYADYLPKQARWQTELLLESLAASEKIDQALAEFIRISRDIDRLTALAETAPQKISSERAIILKSLARDLDRTLAALDSQRQATLEVLEKERLAVMADVKAERAGMSADITAERIAVLKEIERQRQETLAKLEAIGKRLLDDALEDSNAKIDHFFIRTLQVGGVGIRGFVLLGRCALLHTPQKGITGLLQGTIHSAPLVTLSMR